MVYNYLQDCKKKKQILLVLFCIKWVIEVLKIQVC